MSSHHSDTTLPSGSEWFKFEVDGTSNKIPHFKRGFLLDLNRSAEGSNNHSSSLIWLTLDLFIVISPKISGVAQQRHCGGKYYAKIELPPDGKVENKLNLNV